MREEKSFDIVIIGAGSAGLSIAAGMSQLGLKTALIEPYKMGGDCLNTGCIPSKALLHMASLTSQKREILKDNNSSGFELSYKEVHDYVHSIIAKIEPHDSQDRFEDLGVFVIREEASFENKNTLLTESYILNARYFVICTGSSPILPPIEGLKEEDIYTNENIFDLNELPEHLIILGGGPIGCEMAQAFSRLGSKVTIIEKNTLLSKDDPELADIVKNRLLEEKISILENAEVSSVSKENNKILIESKEQGRSKTITGSHLLVAAGRKPNIENLGLEKAVITHTSKGISVDRRLRSSQKHIFAAGDVVGDLQFTHNASYHAGIIIRNIAFKIPAKVNYSSFPWVAYTDPELAHTGLTYEQAVQKLGKKKVMLTSWNFEENDRAVTSARTCGKIKVIHRKNGAILGASIVGKNAGELISLWTLAIQKQLKLQDIASLIVPYPTLSEISKRAAGSYFSSKLFSKSTQRLVKLLQKLPF